MDDLRRIYRAYDRSDRLDTLPLYQLVSRRSGIDSSSVLQTINDQLVCLEYDRAAIELTPVEHIGKLLKQARLKRDEKQAAVAERFGCDTSTISRIERGESPGTTLRGTILTYIREAGMLPG